MRDCDLFVIGGGSGGVRAARLAAARGARVLLAEKSRLGGTCVNVGCVPKKMFYYASGLHHELHYAAAYGRPQATLGDMQWATLKENKDAEITRLNGVYQRLLSEAGVTVVSEAASLQDANTVRAGDVSYRAERILLATGGVPARLSLPGGEMAAVSDDLFELPQLPKSVVLVGSGYIALEFAGIFAGMGVATTLCYRADLPLRGLDEDVRVLLAEGLAQHGVTVISGVSPSAITDGDDGGRRLVLDDGRQCDADLIVFATGRKPATAQLSLENADITPRANGTIAVNEDYCSSCPSVFAVGDLLDTPALTPVAIAEAEVFIKRVFDGDRTAAVDYAAIPTAIFCRPNLATVGLGEAAAAARGINFAVYEQRFRPLKTSFAGDPAISLVKLIVNADDERVIGAQMLGADAAEIMQGIAVAISGGATKSDFDRTVGIHPTSAEEFVTLRQPRSAA